MFELTTGQLDKINRILRKAENEITEATGYTTQCRFVLGTQIKSFQAADKLHALLSLVSNHYGLTTEILMGRCRKRKYVEARQMYFILAHEQLKVSMHKIATYIGYDHSSVVHGRDSINNLIELYEDVRENYKTLLIKTKQLLNQP